MVEVSDAQDAASVPEAQASVADCVNSEAKSSVPCGSALHGSVRASHQSNFVQPSKVGALSANTLEERFLNVPFTLPIADGGGVKSSANWVGLPHEADQLKSLCGHFLSLMREWGIISRLLALVSAGLEQPLFTSMEERTLQEALVHYLTKQGFACSSAIVPHQPFLLEVWQALSLATFDIDSELPELLSEGVPTGIISPIVPSKVWDNAGDMDVDLDCELLVHSSPWKSAADNVPLARSLMMQDVEAGFAYILPGGIDEAKCKWGSHVAAGRLGLVQVEGRKPRLIGDASISGANQACTIPEKVRLPGLQSVQRVLSESDSSLAWVALSFDVASAHKLVRVRPEDQGVGCFALGDEFFVYRSCFFGAKYSAYWFSRVGAWLVRMIHRFVFISHACLLYVDDGLLLLRKEVAPLVASACLAFLTSLGVPLSWRKVRLGSDIVWIGWKFVFSSGHVELPRDKAQKILDSSQPFCTAGRAVERKAVERLIGLLLWFTGGALHLRPWLQGLYHLLYKPMCVFRSLTPRQFESACNLLDQKLHLTEHLTACDLRKGWKLHSVANCAVSSLDADALLCPRLKRGHVDCVFFNYHSPSVRTNADSVWVCKLFQNSVAVQRQLPLRYLDSPELACAADAFADSHIAGVGGWWTNSLEPLRQNQVYWFSLSLDKHTLPKWLVCERLQSYIASFEALGQLLLLLGRVQNMERPASHVVQLRQLCDNAGVASATRKQLSLKLPLAYMLQAISYYALAHGVQLTATHCAGVRNGWADDLSRNKLDGFNPKLRVEFDLAAVLQSPWAVQHVASGRPSVGGIA